VTASARALLEAASITKSFAGVRALAGVSFDVRAGEVHALVGENGAGKSTLIKIMTGAETADSGTVAVGETVVRQMDPHTSRALGIAAIYQQPALFPDLTIAENIALTLESGHAWRRIDWATRRRTAAELLARIGSSLDPERLVETLTMPEQQLIEIAKAIGADARVLIMDEPTAALGPREVEGLFAVIARLRDAGVGIIYISHRLEEVFAIADRTTVLRDGRTVATRAKGEIDRAELIRLMVGRELAAEYPAGHATAGDVVLELDRVSNRATGVHDVSLSVKAGEILGLAGLVGSGRTQLAEIVFGLEPADAGEIRIRGAAAHIASPQEAIAAGIAYVPEDRRRHGVVLEMSVAENASLANLEAVSQGGLVSGRQEREQAARAVSQLQIKTSSVDADVASLSGGNQQKVALARWLATNPSVLILDEPTQGVDVGSKAEIHRLIRDLAGRGLAVLMISSELPEVLGMSDRIAVMHAGTIAGVLSRDEATQDRIAALALERRA
jgi:rhamnose transport system ATP-binding protein